MPAGEHQQQRHPRNRCWSHVLGNKEVARPVYTLPSRRVGSGPSVTPGRERFPSWPSSDPGGVPGTTSVTHQEELFSLGEHLGL